MALSRKTFFSLGGPAYIEDARVKEAQAQQALNQQAQAQQQQQKALMARLGFEQEQAKEEQARFQQQLAYRQAEADAGRAEAGVERALKERLSGKRLRSAEGIARGDRASRRGIADQRSADAEKANALRHLLGIREETGRTARAYDDRDAARKLAESRKAERGEDRTARVEREKRIDELKKNEFDFAKGEARRGRLERSLRLELEMEERERERRLEEEGLGPVGSGGRGGGRGGRRNYGGQITGAEGNEAAAAELVSGQELLSHLTAVYEQFRETGDITSARSLYEQIMSSDAPESTKRRAQELWSQWEGAAEAEKGGLSVERLWDIAMQYPGSEQKQNTVAGWSRHGLDMAKGFSGSYWLYKLLGEGYDAAFGGEPEPDKGDTLRGARDQVSGASPEDKERLAVIRAIYEVNPQLGVQMMQQEELRRQGLLQEPVDRREELIGASESRTEAILKKLAEISDPPAPPPVPGGSN